jgi:hypothetical protein
VRNLIVAGTAAIIAFATIGQLSHDRHVTAGGYAADALPLLAGWWAVAFATRKFVPTWLAGVTVGVGIRAVALSHYHWNQLTFLLVALVFVGLFALIVFRALIFMDGRKARRVTG